MAYALLRCPCTSRRFRVSGWPRVVSGSGGFFWQSVTRVWREARQRTLDGEAVDSPFALPLLLECAVCDRKQDLPIASDSARANPSPAMREVHARTAFEARPREAYRCRVCRRAVVEVVLGRTGGDELPSGSEATSSDPVSGSGTAIEVVARCAACRREGRIAWLDERPSSQQVRLDLLYGRR